MLIIPQFNDIVKVHYPVEHFKIYGTTKNKSLPFNYPVKRLVRLYNFETGNLIQETLSDEVSGYFEFNWIPDYIYFVVSFDHTGQYNGVIATDVKVEPMVLPKKETFTFNQLMDQANPFCWWKLDEASGTAAIDTMGRKDGTYESATLTAPPLRYGTPYSTGFLSGTSQCFVGLDTKIQNMFSTENKATILFWFKSSTVTAHNSLFQYFDDPVTGTSTFGAISSPDSDLEIPSGTQKLKIPKEFFNKKPHLITITKGDKGYTLYIDGVPIINNPNTTGSDNLGLYGFCFPGAGGISTNPTYGYYSDMALFDRDLTSKEIYNLYLAGIL